MPLNGYSSICPDHAAKIVSRDKGNPQEHIANNRASAYVTHYQIDGVVIRQGNKCDYLLINEDTQVAYLIELKGQDLAWAAKQLEATANTLSLKAKGYKLQYRIVANKCATHEIESSGFKKYRLLWKRDLKYKSQKLEENI